jgi:HK97 family phage portal protein
MDDLKTLISRAWKAITTIGSVTVANRTPSSNVVGASGGAPINTLPGIVGMNPSVNRALQSAAVWACCRVIANSIASLPSNVFEETAQGKVKAIDNPLYNTLTRSPNNTMTASQWMQPTMMSLLLWGNAFTWKDTIGGEVVGLWPLNPARVQIMLLEDGTLGYYYSDMRGRAHMFTSADVIHFRLYTLDGYIGLPVLDYHRMTLDFEAATSAYAYSIYQNSGQPSGVLESPNALTKPQVDRIRESWRETHSGPLNAGKLCILEEGVKYTPLAIPLSQLNYIEEKKFSVEQIARIFGVPPHLIGAMDKPTYASVEQQSIEFVRYTINPYVVSIEQSIDKALLEAPYTYRMNLNGFERSDIRTRYLSYATARQWGWASANDIRELEDQNKIDGGDTYLTPLNMVNAADDGKPLAPASPAQ